MKRLVSRSAFWVGLAWSRSDKRIDRVNCAGSAAHIYDLWQRCVALVRGQEALAASAAFGAQAGAAFDFAGLFVEFANSHFLLDTAALDQLAETADGFLGRFLI